MFFKNKEFLNAIKILNEGIYAADPAYCLKPFFLKNRIKIKKSVINLEIFDNVYIIAIGKAADSMARFVSKKVNFLIRNSYFLRQDIHFLTYKVSKLHSIWKNLFQT